VAAALGLGPQGGGALLGGGGVLDQDGGALERRELEDLSQ
jgi:hypothetical protein